MLTLTQIYDLYPHLPQSPDRRRDVLVEYLQHEVLDSLFKQRDSVHLSFIGGTAIRIVYGSGRFSEDLDFDNFGLSFEEFQRLLDAVVVDMKQKGFALEYRFVEKAAFHCYIRVPDQLQENNLSPLKDEKILIRVDAMRKEKLLEPRSYILNAYTRFRPLQVNTADVILAQKLIAILERHREKGRDFYDVSFLYGRTQPNERYIEETMSMSAAEFYTKVLARCEMLDFTQLARDVAPLLLDPSDVERVRTFLPFIRETWAI